MGLFGLAVETALGPSNCDSGAHKHAPFIRTLAWKLALPAGFTAVPRRLFKFNLK